MRKSIKVTIWVVVVLFAVTVVDLGLCLTGRRPWFVIPVASYLDGGSHDFVGLGYKVYYKNSMVAMREEDGSYRHGRMRGPNYQHLLFPILFKRVEMVWD